MRIPSSVTNGTSGIGSDTTGEGDYRVADLSLADSGRKEIRLAEHEMPGLMALRAAHTRTKPLAGARIMGSLHMTVQAAVFVETLVALGAQVRWTSANVLSTQDHAAAALVVGPEGTPSAPSGVPVFAWRDESPEEYWWCVERALSFPDGGPNMLVDDGGEATLVVHKGVEFEAGGARSPADLAGSADRRALFELIGPSLATDPGKWTRMAEGIHGVTEQTTISADHLRMLCQNGELLFPAIDLSNSVTMGIMDRVYGTRHSLLDGLNRATDTLIGGKMAVVLGYGHVGKGCVKALRGQGARVVVVETDPICALQAAMDGIQVSTLDDVVEQADIVVTATGNVKVVTVDHLARMKDQAIVGNIGDFDFEIDVAGLAKRQDVQRLAIKPQVDLWRFDDGHAIVVLSEGRLLNLGNATGHPSFVMSVAFVSQVLAQIELFTKTDRYPLGVHRLPRELDEQAAHLHLDPLGATLSTLTDSQAEYLGVARDGPFKPEHYRY
ncbi:adenosylhomocysteinase [Salinispora arenicola]|uniref:adenosylhomocysteinase n=1 Tax=Salinispora arenicola TaxID=168697 RepID=UPI0003782FF4|nr:adenosylhomocysteinase [Salinispora arenicola]MCN0153967.1 adenosylhomocysteinase [Salinispora arenicola]